MNGLQLYNSAVNDVQNLEENTPYTHRDERIALIAAKAQLVQAWSSLTPSEKADVTDATKNTQR